MCIATYAVPLAHQLPESHCFHAYPAKKRRPSYSEDYSLSKENIPSVSPSQSDDSDESSSSFERALASSPTKHSADLQCSQPTEYEPKLVLGVNMPDAGWFSKCRGCGCMTAYDLKVTDCCIPLCPRCQKRVKGLDSDSFDSMLVNLSYVHSCWSKMGL